MQLDASLIWQSIGWNASYVHALDILPVVDSTVSYFMRRSQYRSHVVLAEMQYAGTGRFNRQWLTASYANIALSFKIPIPPLISVMEAYIHTLCSAVKALESFGIHVLWKLPNDLYHHGQKLCGVRIDEWHADRSWIVSLGMNVNWSPLGATSLLKIQNKVWNRNILIGHILKNLICCFFLNQSFFLCQRSTLIHLMEKRIWSELKMDQNIYIDLTTLFIENKNVYLL